MKNYKINYILVIKNWKRIQEFKTIKQTWKLQHNITPKERRQDNSFRLFGPAKFLSFE